MKDIVYLVTDQAAHGGANSDFITGITYKIVKELVTTFKVPVQFVEKKRYVPEIQKGVGKYTDGDKIFCRSDSFNDLVCYVILAQEIINLKFKNSKYYKEDAQPEVAFK